MKKRTLTDLLDFIMLEIAEQPSLAHGFKKLKKESRKGLRSRIRFHVLQALK